MFDDGLGWALGILSHGRVIGASERGDKSAWRRTLLLVAVFLYPQDALIKARA